MCFKPVISNPRWLRVFSENVIICDGRNSTNCQFIKNNQIEMQQIWKEIAFRATKLWLSWFCAVTAVIFIVLPLFYSDSVSFSLFHSLSSNSSWFGWKLKHFLLAFWLLANIDLLGSFQIVRHSYVVCICERLRAREEIHSFWRWCCKFFFTLAHTCVHLLHKCGR